MRLIKKHQALWGGLLLISISIGLGCPNGPNGDCDDPLIHQLQISRFTTSSLTNARADEILSDMGTILQTNDGTGDVACCVGFARNGNVTTFATGTGSINSSADFTAVNGQPGNVKVVNLINFCSDFRPGIIGCAPVPGTSFVVVRYTTNQEGILWDHEFGHNKGLPHRNVANALMNGTINVNNKRVNQTECDAFLVPAPITTD